MGDEHISMTMKARSCAYPLEKGIVDERPFSEHEYSIGMSYSQYIERKRSKIN